MDPVQIHLHHGWSAWEIAGTVFGNIVTAASYFVIGEMHRRWGNHLHAGFINACGIGHAVMALNMSVLTVPFLMFVTHGVLTPLISAVTVVEYWRKEKPE